MIKPLRKDREIVPFFFLFSPLEGIDKPDDLNYNLAWGKFYHFEPTNGSIGIIRNLFCNHPCPLPYHSPWGYIFQAQF